MSEHVVWRNPRKNRHDVIALLFKLGIILLGLGCFYGSFWWYNTNLVPFIGLTLTQALEMPILSIIFAIASFWVIPGFFFAGIALLAFVVGIILG